MMRALVEEIRELAEGALVSPSSRGVREATPLDLKQQKQATQAGHKAAAYFDSRKDKRTRNDFEGLFIWASQQGHLPKLAEHKDPQYWEWYEWFKRGVKSFFRKGFPAEFDLYGADKKLRQESTEDAMLGKLARELREAADLTEARRQGEESIDFDLTDFGSAAKFKQMLKKAGLSEEPRKVKDKMIMGDGRPLIAWSWSWDGDGVRLETNCNPLTGKAANPAMGRYEKGYASYMEIKSPDRARAMKLAMMVRKHAEYIKGEGEGGL